MKTLMLIFLSLTVFGRSAHADAETDRYAKIFADTYLREQVKEHVRVYINANPAVVGSTSKVAGTATVRFISRLLSVYSFIVAKSDMERAFAAAQMVDPEPTTALCILAVQIAATVNEMNLQKSLAKTYAEIAKINVKTKANLRRYGVGEAHHQLDWIEQVQSELFDIARLEKKLTANPMYQAINGAKVEVTAQNIEDELNALFDLQSLYSSLQDDSRNLELVQVEMLGLPPTSQRSWRQLRTVVNRNSQSLDKLEESFRDVFRMAMKNDLLSDAAETERESGDMSIYCIQVISNNELVKTYPTIDLPHANESDIEMCREKLNSEERRP